MHRQVRAIENDGEMLLVSTEGTVTKLERSSAKAVSFTAKSADANSVTASDRVGSAFTATGAFPLNSGIALSGTVAREDVSIDAQTAIWGELDHDPEEGGLDELDLTASTKTWNAPAVLGPELVQFDGKGTLADVHHLQTGAVWLFARPSTAEGDHLSALELVGSNGEPVQLHADTDLTGTGRALVDDDDEVRFVLADAEEGMVGWIRTPAGWEPLAPLPEASAASAGLDASGRCVAWRQVPDGIQPMQWKDELWETAGPTAPAVDALGVTGGRSWLLNDGEGDDWRLIEDTLAEHPTTVAQGNSAVEPLNHWCNNKLFNIIQVNELSGTRMRYRKFRPAAGDRTEFLNQQWSTPINQGFYDLCEVWTRNISWHFRHNSPYEKDLMIVDWFGTVGVQSCNRESSAHNRARGFDLCSIEFTNGFYLDCNKDWTAGAPLVKRRRYLGVWASLRRKFITVLTQSYNPVPHRDHIHFDNLARLPPIRKSAETDTELIQTACNLLNGANLLVDGDWGGLTQTAYDKFIRDINALPNFRVPGNPLTDLAAADRLLLYIQGHALSNSEIGEWPGYKR